jgi:DNA polymerase III subunit delta
MQTEVKMTYSELKEQVVRNDLSNIYLFEGEEEYLQEFGTALIKNKVIADDNFDIHIIEGGGCLERLESMIDSFPLFNKCKFIEVRDSELFTAGNNNRVASLIEKITGMDKNTYIIFREAKTEKRSALYSGIRQYIRTLSCEQQNDTELIKWVVKIFKSRGFTIAYDIAKEFVEMSDRKMNSVMSEINKVLMFKEDDRAIRRSDIVLMTTKSITDNIFDLTDALAKKNKSGAVRILDEMITLREPEQKILYHITTNFLDMIKVMKLRKKNKSNQEIAELTGIKFDWKVRKLVDFSRKFTEDELKKMIGSCVKADSNIKSGLYDPRLSLEVLMLEIAE